MKTKNQSKKDRLNQLKQMGVKTLADRVINLEREVRRLSIATENKHKENQTLRDEVERLKGGLRYYADHNHLTDFPTAWLPDWDTCSGEPANWWFNSEEVPEQTVGVEDGSIAAAILNGAVMTPNSDETVCVMPSKEYL